jgi:hypothetical protein
MDASKLIDRKIASLSGWRGAQMKNVRELIRSVDPKIVEEWKWMGTPAWNRDGILCIANAHAEHVKVTFSKGAKLPDPRRVFNAGLGGNLWRAIDLCEGDTLDAVGFEGLVRAAIALNGQKPAKRKPTRATRVTAKKRVAKKPAKKKATR